jgi:hypothetical protein
MSKGQPNKKFYCKDKIFFGFPKNVTISQNIFCEYCITQRKSKNAQEGCKTEILLN